MEDHQAHSRRVGSTQVDRAALDGIIYQMRSGCQWNVLPKKFGDDSSVYRTFQRWVNKGVLECIWATLVKNCEELGGVEWQRQPHGVPGDGVQIGPGGRETMATIER